MRVKCFTVERAFVAPADSPCCDLDIQIVPLNTAIRAAAKNGTIVPHTAIPKTKNAHQLAGVSVIFSQPYRV